MAGKRTPLTDEQAQLDTLRLYLEGRVPSVIARQVGRPVAQVRTWLEDVRPETLARLGRDRLGTLYMRALQQAVDLVEPAKGESPRQALDRLTAARYAEQLSARALRAFQELTALGRQEEPPEPQAEPTIVP